MAMHKGEISPENKKREAALKAAVVLEAYRHLEQQTKQTTPQSVVMLELNMFASKILDGTR